MADNKETAKFVMENIGGEENVNSLVHCATRLRFVLKDDDIPNEEALKNHPGILTAQKSGGQYQVVIGNNVSKVYQEIMDNSTISKGSDTENNADDIKSQARAKNPLARVFEYVSGTFSPLIPALAGSGMIKAILAVLTLFNWIDVDGSTYAVLNAASNGLFYFFPIFIGIAAAKQLNLNMFVGGVIGAGLLEPSFTALMGTEGANFMGIPLILSDYASTVFPMLVSIAIYAPLERFLKKYTPDTIQLFFVPMMAILIMVPLTALVFGPFSQYISSLIAMGLEALLGFSSILTGIIFAAAWPFLVVFGVHWGVTPISIDNLTRGGDPLNAMAAGATFAQMGIAFGIFLKYRKNKQLSSLGLAGTVSGVLAGVTEPILYGLVLRYKRLIPIMIISSAVGGGLVGAFGAQMYSFAFNSVLTIPAYGPIPQYVLSISAAFLIAAVLTYIFGIDVETEEAVTEGASSESTSTETETPAVASTDADDSEIYVQKPMQGEVVELAEIPDPVFSQALMGQGVGFKPTDGKVVSPFDGEVVMIAETKHAIGLKSDSGIEVLIHIGLETVELEGEPFNVHVAQGDRIEAGQLLVEADLDMIKESGRETVTPFVITNSNDFESVAVGEAEDGQLKIDLIK